MALIPITWEYNLRQSVLFIIRIFLFPFWFFYQLWKQIDYDFPEDDK